MSTPAELLVHRATAGTRWQAAVTEARSAYGDLAAIEQILNANVGSTASFGTPPDVIPLRHPVYAPDISGSFGDDVRAALAIRAPLFGTPDPE